MELTNLQMQSSVHMIRMLRERTEYGNKIREEVKTMLSEIKKNLQVINSEGKEAGVQISNLEHKGEINSQLIQNEETRIKKIKERIRWLWDISKCTNIRIIGMPEKEEEQEIENLFEKIMKENFPNLVEEIDMQVQEAQRVPNKLDPKRQY